MKGAQARPGGQRITNILRELHDNALDALGPRHWWPVGPGGPGDGGQEIVIGAILTQNTNWSNVVKAIDNLRAAGKLSFQSLDRARETTVARLIRPSGYFNLKAKRLKSVVRFFMRRCGGDLDRLRGEDPEKLRAELLAVHGIGPETADCILLYALEMPIFVIDAYTRRILSRHGLAEPDAGYEELRQLFESRLDSDVAHFNEFHALLVAIGARFCRPKPLCATCPLCRASLFADRVSWTAAKKIAKA